MTERREIAERLAEYAICDAILTPQAKRDKAKYRKLLAQRITAALDAAFADGRADGQAEIARLNAIIEDLEGQVDVLENGSQFGPCQHPGCKKDASAGMPTPGGYMWLCFAHSQEVRAQAKAPKDDSSE